MCRLKSKVSTNRLILLSSDDKNSLVSMVKVSRSIPMDRESICLRSSANSLCLLVVATPCVIKGGA